MERVFQKNIVIMEHVSLAFAQLTVFIVKMAMFINAALIVKVNLSMMIVANAKLVRLTFVFLQESVYLVKRKEKKFVVIAGKNNTFAVIVIGNMISVLMKALVRQIRKILVVNVERKHVKIIALGELVLSQNVVLLLIVLLAELVNKKPA